MGCERGGWDGALGTGKDGKEKVAEEKKNAFEEQSSRAKNSAFKNAISRFEMESARLRCAVINCTY